MANEVTMTARLSVANGNYSESRAATSISADQSTLGGQAGVQNIGTTYEAISLGNVTTEGWVYLRNLHDTNYVEIGLDAGADLDPVIRLNAGEATVFRLSPSATLYAKANTGAVDVDVFITEN
jgi:hypothetical protein